jgi:hypothetical protein
VQAGSDCSTLPGPFWRREDERSYERSEAVGRTSAIAERPALISALRVARILGD